MLGGYGEPPYSVELLAEQVRCRLDEMATMRDAMDRMHQRLERATLKVRL